MSPTPAASKRHVDPMVAVHTMGKVGSKSMALALRWSGVAAVHCHFLEPEYLAELLQEDPVQLHAVDAETLRSHVRSGGRARLICLVRDPLMRNEALFLSQLRAQIAEGIVSESATPAELAARFRVSERNLDPITWWHAHLRTPLGVDVFAEPFDIERGYSVVRADRIDALAMRSDLPDEQKRAVVSEFLEVDMVEIPRLNSSREGPHAERLDEVRAELEHDPAVWTHLRQAPEVTHWFTADELDEFWRRAVAARAS